MVIIMQSKGKDALIVVRLFPDEAVHDVLETVCHRHEVETAVVVSAVGQLCAFRLGYFKTKGDYTPAYFEEPHELLSLAGTITRHEDGYNLHLHAVLGNEAKAVVGGHLIEGTVAVTNEIVLLRSEISVERRLEEESGLLGLFLE